MNDFKTDIQNNLTAFQTLDLHPAALALLNTLGYASNKTLDLGSKRLTHAVPAAFLEGCAGRRIGEKLARLTADSPDLFAVIQKEGKV